MPETVDLRNLPLSALTSQEIKSRLHLIRDEQVRLHAERIELARMEEYLLEELRGRDD